MNGVVQDPDDEAQLRGAATDWLAWRQDQPVPLRSPEEDRLAVAIRAGADLREPVMAWMEWMGESIHAGLEVRLAVAAGFAS